MMPKAIARLRKLVKNVARKELYEEPINVKWNTLQILRNLPVTVDSFLD